MYNSISEFEIVCPLNEKKTDKSRHQKFDLWSGDFFHDCFDQKLIIFQKYLHLSLNEAM